MGKLNNPYRNSPGAGEDDSIPPPEDEWSALDGNAEDEGDLDELTGFQEEASEETPAELDMYLVTADDKLKELGLEPCAFRWSRMSQEERRQVYLKLAELRDRDEKYFNLTADCAFLLNSRLVFGKCHQRCRGDHTVEAVQTAFSDFWSFAREHWGKYDPKKSLFSSYLSMGFYKVSSTTAMNVVKMSASKHYNMGLLARAEQQIMQETGVERVDDVALRMKTGISPTMIKQYREYQQVMRPAELDVNMKMTESFSAGKRHLMSPERIAQEDDLIQKFQKKVMEILRTKREKRIAMLVLGLTDCGRMTPKEVAYMMHLGTADVQAEWLRIRSILQKDPDIRELLEHQETDGRKEVKTVQVERSGDLDLIAGQEDGQAVSAGSLVPENYRPGRKRKKPLEAVSSVNMDRAPERIPVIDLNAAVLDSEALKRKEPVGKPGIPAVSPAPVKPAATPETQKFDYAFVIRNISAEIAEFEAQEAIMNESGKELEERMSNIQKLYEAAAALNVTQDAFFVNFRGTQETVMRQMQENGRLHEKIGRRLPVLKQVLEGLQELERMDA